MAQKRIDFFGGFEPSAVGSGAMNNMNQLAGLGKELQDLAIGYGNKKAVERGVAKGSEIGTEALTSGEGFEDRSEFFIGAAERNETAQKTYVAGSLAEGEMSANRVIAEFPTDREAGMQAYRDVITPMLGATNVPKNTQIALSDQFMIQERALTQFYDLGEARIAFQERQQAESNIAQNLVNTALLSAGNNNKVDSTLAIDDLKDFLDGNELFGTIETRDNFIGEAESQVNVTSSFAQIDQAVLQNPMLTDPQKLRQSDELIANLKDFDIEMDLTVDQRYQVIKKAETATNKLRAELKAANTISKAQQNKIDSITNVENFISQNATGYPVGYNLPDKDVNVYYTESFLPQAQNITDPNQLSAAYVDFANIVGRVPTAQKQDIMASLNSGDPEAIKFASIYIDDILGQQGINTTAFSNQEIAYALTVNTAIEYGAEPLEAIARARKIYDPQSADTVKRRNAELNSDIGSFAFDLIGQELQQAFGDNSIIPFVGSDVIETDPLAYDEMEADYIKLSKQLYLAGTEDYATARKTALKMISANWSNDANANGFGLMKHNPNGFYGVGPNKDVSWVRDIAHEELQAMFPDEVVAKNGIILTSNIRTAKEASQGTSLGQPSYAISYLKEDGTIMSPLIVDSSGRVTNQWSPIPDGETKQTIMQPANQAIMDANADVAREIAKDTTSDNWARGRHQVEVNFRNSYEEQGYSAQNAMAMAEETYIEWLGQDGPQQRIIKSNSPFALIGRGVGQIADGSALEAVTSGLTSIVRGAGAVVEAAITPPEGIVPQIRRPSLAPAMKGITEASDRYVERITAKREENQKIEDQFVDFIESQSPDPMDTMDMVKADRQSNTWGSLYQTESDPEKIKSWIADQQLTLPANIIEAIDKVLPAFKGDKGINNQSYLRELLIGTAKHESSAGTRLIQGGGGPARGAFQIEPKTAKDIVNTSGLIGKKAEKLLGKSKNEILEMNDEEINEFLLDHTVNSVFAIAKYLQAADQKGKLKELKG